MHQLSSPIEGAPSPTDLADLGEAAKVSEIALPFYGLALVQSFEGAAYWTPEGEAKRQALNDWIRDSGAYDAVLDFDRLMRDPARPTRMRAEFDSGDHLHPAPAGYRAMADSIDLDLFRGGVPTK